MPPPRPRSRPSSAEPGVRARRLGNRALSGLTLQAPTAGDALLIGGLLLTIAEPPSWFDVPREDGRPRRKSQSKMVEAGRRAPLPPPLRRDRHSTLRSLRTLARDRPLPSAPRSRRVRESTAIVRWSREGLEIPVVLVDGLVGAVLIGVSIGDRLTRRCSRSWAVLALLPLLAAALLAAYVFGEDSYRGDGVRRWDAYRSPGGALGPMFVLSLGLMTLLAALLAFAGLRGRAAFSAVDLVRAGATALFLLNATALGFSSPDLRARCSGDIRRRWRMRRRPLGSPLFGTVGSSAAVFPSSFTVISRRGHAPGGERDVSRRVGVGGRTRPPSRRSP